MSDRVLPGSDRYRKEAVQKSGSPLIDRANEVPILDVLRDFLGMDLPNTGEKSWKDYCPFGFEHPDSGQDKGWRVYPQTNSSYCFVMHGGMGSVRLVQLRKELSAKKAAYTILDNYGLLQDRGWRERYSALVVAREMKESSVGSPAVLVEALHSALRTSPNYAARQFDDAFAKRLEACLGDLDELLATHADEAAIRAWFVESKALLSEELE